ncbi:substrate-binding periplasmic protein [Niveispirillum irakense]|uniref:substrate-binding periplasmic protein n=1 Tax=Niveispirillum irakense TaxID=34011 RepID=UPI000A038582|nr:transporter substrate-binding domain-containing protein [Niveispirillum irakense]
MLVANTRNAIHGASGDEQRQVSTFFACMAIVFCMGLLVLISAAPARGTENPLLILGFGDFNEAPYGIVHNGELQGGVQFELGNALASQLGRRAVFRHLPRNRISQELISGSIDLYCLASPAFYPNFNASSFTQTLFTDTDLILFAADHEGPTTLEGLSGKRVGAVLGYLYTPALETMFNAGIAIREDARNADANIRKLTAGRIDAIIIPEVAWSYALAREPALSHAIRSERITLGTHNRACLVSPVGNASVEEVDRAIMALKQTRWLEGMIRRFKLGEWIPSTRSTVAASHAVAPPLIGPRR